MLSAISAEFQQYPLHAEYYAECRNAECHILFIIIQSVIKLNVIMPASWCHNKLLRLWVYI